MPPAIENFIINYGYLSIFILVFLQELGVPSFPNEVLLLFVGYLCFKSFFSLTFIIILAAFADVLGSITVYFMLYYFTGFLIKVKPRFINLSSPKILSLKQSIHNNYTKAIIVGRLTPFLRGYIGAIAGSFKIPFKQYALLVLLSAFIWNAGFIIVGYFIASRL